MPIRFTCKCGKRLKVADKFAGKQAKCPECGIRLLVPAATPPEPTESPRPVEVEPVEKAPPESEQQEPELDLAPPSEDQLVNLDASTTDFTEEPGEEALMGLGLEEPAPDQKQELGVSEQEGGGIEIGPDQSLATPEEAKDYENVQLQEDLQKDTSGAPPAGEEVPAGMKACPSCGAYCEAGAVMCVQCGRRFEGAEPSKQPEAPAAEPETPARKKTPVGVIVGIIAGAVVLIGLIIGLGLFALNMLTKKTGEAVETAVETVEEEAGAVAERAQPEGAGERESEPQPEPEPEAPPPPQAAWNGFAEPARQQHAALWRLGAALRAHIEETGGPPAELGELINDRAALQEITFLDMSGDRLQQFGPLAHTAPSRDRVSVLFSDGTVRPMRLQDLEEAKLRSSRDGLLSGADIAVLAELAPRVHVSNERFATLQVLIDEEPVGDVPFRQEASFSVTPGSHEVQFGVDDERTDPIRLEVARGVEYFMMHPAHVKLPIIPLRTYRSVFVGQRSIYRPERNGRAFTALLSEFERVVFPGGDGRLAIPQTMDSIEARIERKDHVITGRSGSPIGVSDISRIRDGLLRHQNGQEVTYYASKLGTLALEVRMNTAAARLAELHLPEILSGDEEDEDYDDDDEDYYEARRRRPRRDWRDVRRGEYGVEDVPEASVSLEVSERLYEPQADFQRLSQALRHSLAGLTPTVVRQVEAIGRIMKMQADEAREEEDDDRAFEEEEEEYGRDRERRMPTTAESVVGHELTPPAAMPDVLPPETILAQVAMLGDPAFVGPLFTLRREAGEIADEQSQYLFALARCSGANSLAQLGVASDTNPGAVAVACTTVDNPAADSVLVNLLRDATVPEVAAIAEGWPVAAGPSCRRAFIEAVAGAMPVSLEDARLLNALQKLDAYTLEEVLLARFKAELDPSAQPVELPDDRERDDEDYDEDEDEDRRRAQAEPAGAPHSWSLLAAWNNPVAVEKMVELTEGDDAEAARKACVALSRSGDESMVDALAALLGHGDKSVRSAAAWSLVRLGHSAGLDHVQQQLKADMVSEKLIEQAGKQADVYGRQRTAEFLVAVIGASLETPAEPKEKPDDSREYWEEEEEFLQAEKPKSLTAVAIRYAGELGIRSDALVNALQQATRATAPDGRIAAYRHLARLQGGGPQPDLAAQALTDSDPEVRKVGLSLLHGASSAEALAMLRDSMQLPNADVREAAIRVVPTLTDPMEAVGVVVRGIADQDYKVMQAAAQTAMTFEGPVPPLGRAIANRLNALRGEVTATRGEEEDWLEREERRREREEFEEDEGFAVPGLQRDPGTPAGRIMLLADAAGALRASKAAAALQIHLTSPDAAVRMTVTEALAKIGDPGSVHALMQMLDDADPDVRSGVVQALVQLNVPAGNEALISRLNDNSLPPQARRQVLGFLAQLAADDASVQEALTDSISLTIRDLDTLAELAETAPGEHTAGYRMIGRIYLRKRETRPSAEGRDEDEWEEDWWAQERARQRELELAARWNEEGRLLSGEEEERRPASATAREAAGRILANLKNDPEADRILREAFDRNPSGLYEAMAGQVTAMNQEGKLRELQELYKQLAARAMPAGGREDGAVAREALRRMRESIVNAVVAHGGEDAPSALRRLAAYEKQQAVRRQIVSAFGRLSSKDSVHYLVEFAMRDESYYGEVADALGRIGQVAPEQSRGMLGRIMKSSRSGYVEQATAADALDRLDRTEAAAL